MNNNTSSGKSFSLSKFAIILTLTLSLVITASNQQWKQKVINWDVISYYAYAPGLFIYNDLTFTFLETINDPEVVVWTETTPDNKRVIKMTSGLAVMYTPFFLIAHGISLLQPEMYTPNGYSIVYSLFLILSDIFYTIIGLIFLRRILIQYFSDSITAIVLLAIFFGSNLLYYSMFEVMSHCYNFCLITMFLYYTIKWHASPTIRTSIYLGLLFGLITLIRPVNILIILIWVFYGIESINKEEALKKVQLWLQLWKSVLIIAVLSFLVFSLQIAYWKYSTGNFFYWSYTNESFFWFKPHVLNGLIGFRKGWYIYSPIMILATIGLVFSKKYIKNFYFSFMITFPLFVYVIFCWWCWWYGGGLSCRPLIDIYGIMGIGLACIIQYIFDQKYLLVKYTFSILLTCFVLYGITTTIQYRTGALHYDSMTFKSWKINLFSFGVQGGYHDNLSTPNYKGAIETGKE